MIQQDLPKLTFKQFSKGLVSVKDLESGDAPMDCFAEGVNVEINNPIGAVSRSPGYYQSEQSWPVIAGYSPKYFTRWSVDNPTTEEILILYYKNDSGQDFRIYIDLSGVWIELTEKILSFDTWVLHQDADLCRIEVPVSLIAHGNESDYYNGWIVKNTIQNQYARIFDHTIVGSTAYLWTVENLNGYGYAWTSGEIIDLHRSPVTAFYPTSLSDITNTSFLALLGRLRIGTGIGADAVAQWVGYVDKTFTIYTRSLISSGFYLEQLNKGFDASIYEVFNSSDPSYANLQVVFTAVDIEGSETVVASLIGASSKKLLNGASFDVSLLIKAYGLSNRIVSFNLYANSNTSAVGIFFLQSTTLASTPILNSANTVTYNLTGTYTETGRQLYYLPDMPSEVKFKAIKYNKGRVFVIPSDNQDYVRFTQFNTNGSEVHDFFPYEIASGFGYFIVAAESSDKNVGLAISKDGNLIVFKNNSTYTYGIQDGRFFQESLLTLFSGIGAISQQAVDDTSDFGTFFADYRNVYLYVGGVGAPQRILAGKLQKWYQSLLNSYKNNIQIKYNRQLDELWILIQVSGTAGSTIASDYRILVYNHAYDNFRMLQPYHLVLWMDNNRNDAVIEILANSKIQSWDYSTVVYTHDGQVAPEPYLRTHHVTADISIVQRFVEIYAQYSCTKNFTLRPIASGQSDSNLLNKKTFVYTKIKMFIGLMVGYVYTRFCLLLSLGTDAGDQQINEFGLTYFPSGGKYAGRK